MADRTIQATTADRASQWAESTRRIVKENQWLEKHYQPIEEIAHELGLDPSIPEYRWAAETFGQEAAESLLTQEQPEDDQDHGPKLERIKGADFIARARAGEFKIDTLVNKLVARRAVTLFYGEPGSGKSCALRHLAFAMANGVDWLGHTIEKPLLVEHFPPDELADTIAGHYDQLHRLYNARIPTIHIRPTHDPYALLNLTDVYPQVMEHRPDVVILDLMGAFIDMAQVNDYGVMLKAMDEIRKMAHDADCAIIIAHHANKSREDNGNANILGSAVIAGKIDQEFDIRRVKDNDGQPLEDYRTFTVRKRFGHVPKQYVRLGQYGEWTLADDLEIEMEKRNTGGIKASREKKDANAAKVFEVLTAPKTITQLKRELPISEATIRRVVRDQPTIEQVPDSYPAQYRRA